MIDALEQFISDASHMADTIKSEGWDAYMRYLTAVESEEVEALIQSDMETDFKRGYIQGLRRAAQLPQEVIDNTARARKANG